jgi:HSP20 family protein
MNVIQYQRPGFAGFRRLNTLQDELDRLFEASLSPWVPALDVHEDKNQFTVQLEAPGLKREDIAVQLEDGDLVISGERKSETVSEDTEVHRRERVYGKFSRTISLTAAVSADKVKAAYKDGVLTVTLPKAEEAKPKQIEVAVN